MFWPSSLQFWRLLPGCCAPFPSAVSGPGSQRFGALSPGVVRLFPPRRAARAARGLVPSPRVRRAFSLRGPSARRPVGSQEVFRQEPGPVFRVGGGGFSGAEFDPFPSPCLLPPAGMGQLFSRVSQSLCFANRQRCVPAGQFFSRSPTVKKKSPSDCSQGLLAGPYPKQCRRLLSVPPPLAGGWCGHLGVLFCWELLLGM